MHLRAPAVPKSAGEIRRVMRAHLEQWDLDAWQIADVLTAIGEAVLNTIEHAYSHLPAPGHVDVVLRTGQEQIVVVIQDEGSWKHHTPRTGRGHGFEMMRAVAGRLSVDDHDGPGTTVYMSFPLSAGGKNLLQKEAV